jgi:Holliday junction resolvasome RuvABC ATP-dependent DNA helicase subunit
MSAALTSAVTTLRSTGVAAGLSAVEVDAEVAAFVAAINGSVPGASLAWATAFGRAPESFGAAVDVGRPWRDRPTPLLSRLAATSPGAARAYATALVDVASAAYGLGEPTLSALGVAGAAAAAQLRVVGGPVLDPSSPGSSTPGASPAANPAPNAVVAAVQPTAAAPPPATLAELLADLDDLVGLEKVKTEVHRQAELLRVQTKRAAKGLKSPDVTRHLVFVGNPGTGKSTVARLVGGIYRALGLLDGGHVVETDRAGLVAGYLGQTAEKTSALLATAYGGLLFIDEAYALVGDQYGDEAIATLVKAMEDHRDELVVIVAGYPEPMERLIAANPGLASRFRLTIEFDDYTDDELAEIFSRQCATSDFTPTSDCLVALRLLLARTERDESFGNARFVRNTFEAAVVRQAWRLRDVADPSVHQLRELRPEDLVEGDERVQPPD